MAKASYYADHNRRNRTSQSGRYGYVNVDGNTVRKQAGNARPVPEQRREQQKPKRQKRQSVSSRTRQNRARALNLNPGYVLFLTVASVLTLFVCVNYLKLWADNVMLRNDVASQEVRLSELKTENDAVYEKTMASVDLEEIRDIAIHKLGMMYAGEEQVRTYDNISRDYVRQYGDVPEE